MPPERARRSQAVHSFETILTMFERLRKAVCGRSSTVMRPSVLACRIAVFTVERDTPATAAMWSTYIRQSPRRAVSASVNRAAMPCGSLPEAAQRRRRSMLSI
ncbi:hypothetical protein ASF34_20890 [Methylobacterium sp. Leaf106]|nr:hypothetical protein ASF34_20890 [Methylobacterium sp. Leaf106]